MKNKGIEVVTAGFFCLVAVSAGSSRAVVGFGAGQSMDVKEALIAAKAIDVPVVSRDYVTVKWVSINGGKFTMGTDNGYGDEKPLREVTIPDFEMSQTEVTVEQYAECVKKGKCTSPGMGGYCNWGKPDREHHPVNCVDWGQANQYAKSMGARLPSESEWEYAATSEGKNQKYPWGNEDATCERAVMYENEVGCGTDATMDVCSKPAGNTAQDLCDMTGNVWEWVQDDYQDSYANAPTDGRAFEDAAGSNRVLRGGSFGNRSAAGLRASRRGDGDPGYSYGDVGFRLAR